MDESVMKDKREISEAKRRSSLAAKRAEEKQRQATISLSLKSLESLPSKKVVFHSDSEDEPVVEPKRLKLFGEDDDDDNGSDQEVTESTSGVEEMFVNRHFGKRGAKLAKLEAKFGHDARFRMDEKFMDSDDEEEEEKVAEKEAHLAILSKVLGKTVKTNKASVRKAPGFRRFDPENELHLQWVESTKKKKKKENENPDDASEMAEEVDSSKGKQENNETKVVEGHFFEMDEGFAESLKKKLAEGGEGKDDSFSFLKSIGRKPDINLAPIEKESNASDDIKENKVEEEQSEELKDDSVYRSSDINLISSTVPVSSAFFLSDNDNEVIQGLKYFRRKRSIEDIRNKWCNVRHGIIKLYKKQRKLALKETKGEHHEASKHRKKKLATA